ncbi:chemokine (C-C motif) ligand 44 [Scomber scombrus]|uniref:Chemokine (C-C motif) ligand 44 n=1 Tax=Scomber scombrus TaxID=13677 RepID=A0AAV1NA46_SCOSC
MFMLQMLTVISLTVILLASVEGKGVQMQRDVQCCMLYSQGKVRTKDVLRFEVQTEGPDCSIQAIMQSLHQKGSKMCRPQRPEGEEVAEKAPAETENQGPPNHVAPSS